MENLEATNVTAGIVGKNILESYGPADLDAVIDNTQFEMCDIHGRYTAFLLQDGSIPRWVCVNASCPVCKSEKKVSDIIAKAGVPKRFLNSSFDNYVISNDTEISVKQIKQKTRVQNFADNFEKVYEIGSSAILSGSVGTGKTHLACAVANQLAKAGKTSCFKTVTELVQSVRDAWKPSSVKSASQVIDEYASFDLLIIDEFGVQSGTNSEMEILFSIINRRYNDETPILALTNLSENEFIDRIGIRVYDRLTHLGAFLTLDWPSYRPTDTF